MLAEYKKYGGVIEFATCPYNNRPGGYLWRAPARPVVTAALVRARVVRMIPVAALGLAPKTATLVNIQTVMWVDAAGGRSLPVVRILGQRVVIRLVADYVEYDFGDGHSDGDGPVGKAYDHERDPCRTRLCPDYYGLVYAVRGVRTVSAVVYWRAGFSVDGGRVQQVPGVVAGPVSSARVRVREARGVLVPNP